MPKFPISLDNADGGTSVYYTQQQMEDAVIRELDRADFLGDCKDDHGIPCSLRILVTVEYL